MTKALAASMGGKARARSLTPAQRRRIARQAAFSRWVIVLSRPRVFDVLRHMDALSRGTRPTTGNGVRRELRDIAEKFFHVIQR